MTDAPTLRRARSEDAAAYDATGQSHTINTRRPRAVA